MSRKVFTQEEARKILADHPPRFFSPPAVLEPRTRQAGECPICGFPDGHGFLQANVPVGHKLFGELIYCSCWEEEVSTLLAKVSGLKGDLLACSLGNLIVGPGRDEAVGDARAFVKRPLGFVTFWGDYGVGKTYLLAAIINGLRERGLQGLYVPVPDLLDKLRDSYDEKCYASLLADMRKVRVLALDELGQAKATDWAVEKLLQILDYRYTNPYRLGTLVALSFNPDEPPSWLSEKMGAILSRLHGTVGEKWPIVEIKGKDLRGKI